MEGTLGLRGWPVVHMRMDIRITGSIGRQVGGRTGGIVYSEALETRYRTSAVALALDVVFALALSVAALIATRAIIARRFGLRELFGLMFVAAAMLGVMASASAISVPLHPR